jgi:SulP family sulfate permease
VDLTDVPHLGVTTSLAIEGAVRDALAHGCRVYFAGLQAQPSKRLQSLDLGQVIPPEAWIGNRVDALKRAVAERAGQTATSA